MRSKSLVVAVALASLAGACADGAGEPMTNAPADDPAATTSVDGSSGVTGQIEGDWIIIEGVPTVPGYPISLSVTGSEFSGRSACNLYGGTAGIAGASLAFEDMGMTDMGCEGAVMDSESAYLRALAAVTGWRIADGRLELLGPAVPLVFERAPEVPISELVGTVWVLETVIEGDEAFSAVGDPATLILNDDGSLSGSTGCRSLDGSWTLANGQVFLPELSADGRCSADLAVQDSIVVNVLGDGFTPSVDGGVLTLTSMGNEGLVYRVEG
jgi:heat shock protein HslJ